MPFNLITILSVVMVAVLLSCDGTQPIPSTPKEGHGIAGTVRTFDDFGNLLVDQSGTRVEAYSTSSGLFFTETDATGSFFISNVPAGVYKLSAMRNGYDQLSAQTTPAMNVVYPGADILKGFKFWLTKVPDARILDNVTITTLHEYEYDRHEPTVIRDTNWRIRIEFDWKNSDSLNPIHPTFYVSEQPILDCSTAIKRVNMIAESRHGSRRVFSNAVLYRDLCLHRGADVLGEVFYILIGPRTTLRDTLTGKSYTTCGDLKAYPFKFEMP